VDASRCHHRKVIEVVAHRGTREGAEEHTFAAYRKAIADGADALECDVRLTADGHLVCVHDRRVDRVSDGHGVVSSLELADLAELQFGPRKDWRPLHLALPFDKHHERDAKGRRSAPDPRDTERPDLDATGVLTLRRLLELVASSPRPVRLAIETKHPTRYGALVEERLIEMLDEFGWGHPRRGEVSPVRVMSFSPASLRRLRRMAPSLERVLLMARVPTRHRDGSLPLGCTVAGVDIRVIRRHPEYVERAHARGNRVHVWTVNDLADVDRCARAGVDAIITDRPLAVGRHLLDARPSAGLM
jgi:glycerophosphoryl diester phosphodiesterase